MKTRSNYAGGGIYPDGNGSVLVRQLTKNYQLNEMRNIFAEIERKERAIWLVSILLATYNILKLISIIAAPYPIDQIVNRDGGISFAEYPSAFHHYINEESERLQMPPASLTTTLFFSGGMAAGYIIISLFLGMRKEIARFALSGLILIELAMDIVVGIKYSILPSKISILVAVILLLFLFSHNIAKEFK